MVRRLILIGAVVLVATLLFATRADATEELFERRAATYAQCPCPCELTCAGGGGCKCTGAEGKCVCAAVEASAARLAQVLTGDPPVVQYTHAEWFDAAPFETIGVTIEAVTSSAEAEKSFSLQLVPSEKERDLYVPDAAFDAQRFARWAAAVDKSQPGRLIIAASGDSLAACGIRDGNLAHLHESLVKRFSFLPPGRPPVALVASDSTLAWEIQNAIRTGVTCMSKEAFIGDAGKVRDELYGQLGTLDLMLQARDVKGALDTVSEIERQVVSLGLDAKHPNTDRLLRIVAAARSLLTTGRGGAN